MQCINSGKYTMTATLLNVDNNYSEVDTPADLGQWVESQDPVTKEFVNVWVPGRREDDLFTPSVDERVLGDFACVARGTSTGDRFGSTEKFGSGGYQNLDIVKMWVPSNIRIKKSDRITNIRKDGVTLWLDEDDSPVTFNINGIVPQFGPFNSHLENFLLLERTEF